MIKMRDAGIMDKKVAFGNSFFEFLRFLRCGVFMSAPA